MVMGPLLLPAVVVVTAAAAAAAAVVTTTAHHSNLDTTCVCNYLFKLYNDEEKDKNSNKQYYVIRKAGRTRATTYERHTKINRNNIDC